MNTHITETELARRLREEAAGDSPGFSPLLHERIMERVGRASRLPGPQSRTLRMPWVFGLAAAAAVALAIGLSVLLRPSKPGSRAIPQIVQVDPLPSPASIVDTHVTPMYEQFASAMDERKLAYLDRDARELTDFVKGRLSLAMVGK